MGKWEDILQEEQHKNYFDHLKSFVEREYQTKTIYPAKENIYRALELTPLSQVKVVILGQDPYHGPHQAHGLSFSVASNEAKFPPSLRNLFKELKSDTGIERTEHNLSDWAEQGVLLLNTVLTVEAGKAASHRGKGWELLTDRFIEILNKQDRQIIFVLWGNDAKKKIPFIINPKHKIITSAHPSPLSAHRGFFGSQPFSKINTYLRKAGEKKIIWG